MPASAIVTAYSTPQASPNGFTIDVDYIVQDPAIPKYVAATVPSVVLTGAPTGWNALIAQAVVNQATALGFSLVALNVNLPAYTHG